MKTKPKKNHDTADRRATTTTLKRRHGHSRGSTLDREVLGIGIRRRLLADESEVIDLTDSQLPGPQGEFVPPASGSVEVVTLMVRETLPAQRASHRQGRSSRFDGFYEALSEDDYKATTQFGRIWHPTGYLWG